MVSIEPLLETPFESASNTVYKALFAAGIALLGVVAALGRGPLTAALVIAYLLAVPGYVLYRTRTWDGLDDDETIDEEGESEDAEDSGSDGSDDREGDDGDHEGADDTSEGSGGDDRNDPNEDSAGNGHEGDGE